MGFKDIYIVRGIGNIEEVSQIEFVVFSIIKDSRSKFYGIIDQKGNQFLFEKEKLHENYIYAYFDDLYIHNKEKYINDLKSWKPVFVVLIVPPGTKVILHIKKGKVKSCRAQKAIVKAQYQLDGFNENSIITESKSFYDNTFIYRKTVEVKDLNNNAGIYMYCDKIDAKCH